MSAAVILLNYRRPQNIAPIVRATKAALLDAPIFLLDQSGSAILQSISDFPWEAVWYKRPLENNRAGARLKLAAELPFDHYLAIDDDVLLVPQQIAELMASTIDAPLLVHGVTGRRMEINSSELQMSEALAGGGPLSVIHSVYGFSRAQARGALKLADELGFKSWSDVRFGDDLLLSSASGAAPMCHDIGMFSVCGSHFDPGVAIAAEAEFGAFRRNVTQKLLDRKLFPTFPALAEDNTHSLRPARDLVRVVRLRA